MGGPRSGNFYHEHRPAKKPLVEHGLRLNVSLLHRNQLFRMPTANSGVVTFGSGSIIGVESLVVTEQAAFVVLNYTTGHEPPIPVNDLVWLTITRPRYGGVRWWFRCPGTECGRRVGVLYLPIGAVHFRCRTCHGLTYYARQNLHRDRAFRNWVRSLRD